MSLEKILVLSAISFFTSFLVTPWARKMSHKWGMVDCPGERKVHTEPVPYGGGIAIFLGFLAAFLFLNIISVPIAAFLLGSLIIVILGIIDDMYGLKALPKFLVQSLAAFIIIAAGIQIDMTVIFRGQLANLAFLSLPLTFFWIVGITNAINIIDGLDGLAAGVSTISAFTLAVVAFLNGQPVAAVLALIIGFAALGFLPHNFLSKVFMGDSGSMFLGYSLATLSILASVKLAAAFSLVVPLIILAIPIFDVLFAIVRRIANGQPIHVGDNLHVHHRLINLGFSPHQTVMIIYLLSIFFGGLAIYSATVRARTGYMVFALSLALVMVFALIVTAIRQNRGKSE